MEYVGSTLMGLLSGCNLLHDVGYLEPGLAASAESITFGNEVVVVDDLEAVVAEVKAAGLAVAMDGSDYGLDGDGAYAYLDTVDAIGTTIELIELPKRRAQPEKTYP